MDDRVVAADNLPVVCSALVEVTDRAPVHPGFANIFHYALVPPSTVKFAPVM